MLLFLFPVAICLCPREESNLDYKIRNLASYPLNDEGICACKTTGSTIQPFSDFLKW